ncbi:MAG: hypothetical protein ACRYF2_17640 [Janthinobacterium lividum]
MQYLIVVRPFGSYCTGDVITDEQAIETVLNSEHQAHIVRILPPSEG